MEMPGIGDGEKYFTTNKQERTCWSTKNVPYFHFDNGYTNVQI